MSRPKLRKVNRAKRKEKSRNAQERMAMQASLMMEHPTECCVCKEPFERTQETVKTWQVTVIQEKKVVRLTCPSCWTLLTEELKRRKVEIINEY